VLPAVAARLGRLSGWRALATAFGLGAIGAAALPPVHAVPVLLIAIPGLLVLLGGKERGWRGAAAIGFAWGWGHHLAGVYWVTHAILVDLATWWWLVPLAAPGLALPLALFSVPPAMAAWALPSGWPRLLGFAGAWVLAEMARGILFTGFPWNLLGTAWAFAALPVQGAAFIGVHGLSLLTVLLAGLPLIGKLRSAIGGIAALLALAALGAVRLETRAGLPGTTAARLILVQGNVAQSMKWLPEERLAIFQKYVGLTRAAVAAAASGRAPDPGLVVIWPETASPFLLAQDAEAQRLAAEALQGASLLAGTVRVEWGRDGRPERVFNSLVALDAAGAVTAQYDKSHLVPFGEYAPLSGLLPVRLAPGGSGGLDFSAGPGPVTLVAPGIPPFGALICYEVIFPAAVTPAPRPAWLVNITNDAWFGLSAGPWQHLATARLRAVEEGLPLARAAQTGISAMFDAHGRRLAMLTLGREGSLLVDLPAPLPPTAFARWGLALPFGLAVAALLLGVAAGARRRSSRLGDKGGEIFIEKSQKY
jgi:apolipoprotein N-acyltransferase